MEPLDKDEFSKRKKAVELIKRKYEPTTVLTDNKPNFLEKPLLMKSLFT